MKIYIFSLVKFRAFARSIASALTGKPELGYRKGSAPIQYVGTRPYHQTDSHFGRTFSVLTLFQFSAFALLLAAPAKADEGVGINGGVLADTGAMHIEFIGGAADALMMFAVSDARQKPFPAREISAYAIVAQNGQTIRLRLAPEADNLLTAMPAFPLLTGTTVLVVAKLTTGETLKARFISP